MKAEARTLPLLLCFPLFLSLFSVPQTAPQKKREKKENKCVASYQTGVQRSKSAVRALLYALQGHGGDFYYIRLSSCPLFISLQLSLSLSLCFFLPLFSYQIEGCRILRSGWWSSNSIYSTAQRQTESRRERARERESRTERGQERERERAGERKRGMETADVREHFLLAAARRGRP